MFNYPEAYRLMWYGCSICRHRELIWNSRDGVVLPCIGCPSCGEKTFRHVDHNLDVVNTTHKPNFGQRIWVDLTMDRAAGFAKRIVAAKKLPALWTEDELVHHVTMWIYNDGYTPDLIIYDVPTFSLF
jgi:predicted  nucleic acid-binding Zn-ribbon protein